MNYILDKDKIYVSKNSYYGQISVYLFDKMEKSETGEIMLIKNIGLLWMKKDKLVFKMNKVTFRNFKVKQDIVRLATEDELEIIFTEANKKTLKYKYL